MLTDEELQAIADEYVRATGLPSCARYDVHVEVERVFDLKKPHGTYYIPVVEQAPIYTLRSATLKDEIIRGAPSYMSPEAWPLTSPLEHGFFVFADTGDVRVFSEPEILDAFHSRGIGHQPGPYPELKHIEHILNGVVPEPRPPRPLTGVVPKPPRPWWKFW